MCPNKRGRTGCTQHNPILNDQPTQPDAAYVLHDAERAYAELTQSVYQFLVHYDVCWCSWQCHETDEGQHLQGKPVSTSISTARSTRPAICTGKPTRDRRTTASATSVRSMWRWPTSPGKRWRTNRNCTPSTATSTRKDQRQMAAHAAGRLPGQTAHAGVQSGSRPDLRRAGFISAGASTAAGCGCGISRKSSTGRSSSCASA